MAAALASLVFSVSLTLLTCSSARTQPLYPETLSSNPVGLKTASHAEKFVCAAHPHCSRAARGTCAYTVAHAGSMFTWPQLSSLRLARARSRSRTHTNISRHTRSYMTHLPERASLPRKLVPLPVAAMRLMQGTARLLIGPWPRAPPPPFARRAPPTAAASTCSL